MFILSKESRHNLSVFIDEIMRIKSRNILIYWFHNYKGAYLVEYAHSTKVLNTSSTRWKYSKAL